MHDRSVLLEIFLELSEAIERIQWRFAEIENPDDFIRDRNGLDRLDGISMMLIAIGENIKKLDEAMAGELANRYPEVDWLAIKGLRNILAHSYFSIDAEEVYKICLDDLTNLKQMLLRIRDEIS